MSVNLCVCVHVRVCVCVCILKGKRIKVSTPNLVVHDSFSACIDPEVKRSNIKVTWLSHELPAWICMSVRLLRLSSFVSISGLLLSELSSLVTYTSIAKKCFSLYEFTSAMINTPDLLI